MSPGVAIQLLMGVSIDTIASSREVTLFYRELGNRSTWFMTHYLLAYARLSFIYIFVYLYLMI